MLDPTQGPTSPGPEPESTRPRIRMTAVVAVIASAALAGGAVAAGVTLGILRAQARTNPQSVNLGSNVTINLNDAVIQVAAKARPAVVSVITSPAGSAPVAGSGFLVTSDGLVVTSVRVVSGAAGLSVLMPGAARPSPARVVDYDCGAGVAVLKADGIAGAPTLAFADPSDLHLGEPVVAVAGPLDPSTQVASGTVGTLHAAVSVPSAIDPSRTVTITDAILAGAVLDAGAGGAPVLNVGGQVVGMVAGTGPGPLVALPAPDLQPSVAQIIPTGKVSVPGLGAAVSPVDAADAAVRGLPAGAQVTGVDSGGPADAAGLKAGDVLTQIDDQAIDDAHPLPQVLRAGYSAGQRVTLTYTRGGSSTQLQLVLDSERPACS